ncbi:hypothetical protein ACLOJK_033203 [Asimina triloba]
MDASWKVLQEVGYSILNPLEFQDEQRRLYLYAALFLPLRKSVSADKKGKMIKEFWRAALLLSTLIYPNEYDAEKLLAQQFDLDQGREWFKRVEESVMELGLDNVWKVKALLNGNVIMNVLQLTEGGRQVGEWFTHVKTVDGRTTNLVEWSAGNMVVEGFPRCSDMSFHFGILLDEIAQSDLVIGSQELKIAKISKWAFRQSHPSSWHGQPVVLVRSLCVSLEMTADEEEETSSSDREEEEKEAVNEEVEEEEEAEKPTFDEEIEKEGLRRREKSKRKRLRLEKEAAAADKRGICYLSRIPPHMTPLKLRQILSQYGELQRIYLAPEVPSSGQLKRNCFIPDSIVKIDGARVFECRYCFIPKLIVGVDGAGYACESKVQILQLKCDVSGQVDFEVKGFPKGTPDIVMPYVAYKNAIREQKLALEISAAKRERDFYLSKVDKARALNAIQERSKKKQKVQEDSNSNADTGPKVIRKFKQTRPVGDNATESKPKLSKDFLAGVSPLCLMANFAVLSCRQ